MGRAKLGRSSRAVREYLEQEQRDAARKHDAAHKALCIAAVTEWNRLMERRHKPGWSPMIGVALAAIVTPQARRVVGEFGWVLYDLFQVCRGFRSHFDGKDKCQCVSSP